MGGAIENSQWRAGYWLRYHLLCLASPAADGHQPFSGITSTNAAKYFGLYRARAFCSRAVMPILSSSTPSRNGRSGRRIFHELRLHPYENFPLKGRVRDVFLRRRKVVSGKIVREEADGRYLRRQLPDMDIH